MSCLADEEDRDAPQRTHKRKERTYKDTMRLRWMKKCESVKKRRRHGGTDRMRQGTAEGEGRCSKVIRGKGVRK